MTLRERTDGNENVYRHDDQQRTGIASGLKDGRIEDVQWGPLDLSRAGKDRLFVKQPNGVVLPPIRLDSWEVAGLKHALDVLAEQYMQEAPDGVLMEASEEGGGAVVTDPASDAYLYSSEVTEVEE